jgi:hypothetical protein
MCTRPLAHELNCCSNNNITVDGIERYVARQHSIALGLLQPLVRAVSLMSSRIMIGSQHKAARLLCCVTPNAWHCKCRAALSTRKLYRHSTELSGGGHCCSVQSLVCRAQSADEKGKLSQNEGNALTWSECHCHCQALFCLCCNLIYLTMHSHADVVKGRPAPFFPLQI